MLARLHTSIASTRNGGTLPCGDHDRDVSIANPWRQLPSQLSMPVASGDTTIHHIRTMSLPLQICGTGHYLPERSVRSDELDLTWQRPAGTTERELGIRQRHVGTGYGGGPRTAVGLDYIAIDVDGPLSQTRQIGDGA